MCMCVRECLCACVNIHYFIFTTEEVIFLFISQKRIFTRSINNPFSTFTLVCDISHRS